MINLVGLCVQEQRAIRTRNRMQSALKLNVTVTRERVIRLPDDFPEGPAEVIVLPTASDASPKPHAGRRLGSMHGLITIADDFDAPLPPEIQRVFDGEGDDE